jgi:ubiquinone/menaquinone biosynthesis C-methylase UbiE
MTVLPDRRPYGGRDDRRGGQEMIDDSGSFGAFEQQADYYIEFLDERTTLDDENAVKELIATLLAPVGGTEILDIGTGTGADAIALARSVGPRGRVIGLDRSAEMLAEARRRAAGSGLPLEFVQGDASALSFDDGSFDRCRAERVLVHIADPAAAVREMVRVTRPGGVVVASDIDGGTVFINSSNEELTGRLVRGLTADMTSGWVGRRLQRYFVEAGLIGVRCVPRVIRNSVPLLRLLVEHRLRAMLDADETTEDAVTAFWDELNAGEKAGWLCSGSTCFTVTGIKAG